jgi:hypothetical protein
VELKITKELMLMGPNRAFENKGHVDKKSYFGKTPLDFCNMLK